MKERYFLFTSETHEDVRLDFPISTIERILNLWSEGESYEYICRKCRIKPVEMALIVMDLEYADKLPKRKNGFWAEKQSS